MKQRHFPLKLLAGAVLVSMLGLLLQTAPASGIIMRDDLPDEAYQRLAEDYASTVAWVRARDEHGLVVAEGTLIQEQWVLTAAHVVDDITPGMTTVRVDGRDYAVDDVFVHPEWTGDFEELNDIALLRLAEPVVDACPARIYRGDEEVGTEVVLVGRGMSGTGLEGPVDDDRVLRAARNKIEDAGPKHLFMVFDAPDADSVVHFEGISGPGDSGGPAFVHEADTVYIVGVSSAQDDVSAGGLEGRYGVHEYYTRVSAFADWIDEMTDNSAVASESPQAQCWD